MKEINTIDCCGMLCPLPLIETKKAIKATKAGEYIKVIVDNGTSLSNLKKYLSDNGINAEYNRENERHILTFQVSAQEQPMSNPADYCELPSKESKPKGLYTIVLKSNYMGCGNDTLGEMLMKGFLSTVSELDTLPQEIICYNSGVKLAVMGTPTAENLKQLNSLGVKITLCGTCIDFFEIKKEIAVGEISNMYYIATRLTESNQIVEP